MTGHVKSSSIDFLTDEGGEPAGRETAEDRRNAATLLLQRGLFEAAIAELDAAVEISRSQSDAASEGAAELLFVRAYRQDGAIGDEHVRLALLHSERAETAFRRADDRMGLIDALISQAIQLQEAGDLTSSRYALDKLEAVDAGTASWLRTYLEAVAIMLEDPGRAVGLFQQALDSLDLLAKDADGWRGQCLRKLAFLTGPEASTSSVGADEPSARWQDLYVEAIRLIASGREDEEIEPILDDAIRAAEDLRRPIASEVKQRELSGSMDPLYTAKASIAGRAGRDMEALDTIELNTSRSICSRQSLRFLWSQSPIQTWKPLRDANELIVECLARFEKSKTSAHREQLRLALKRRREASHFVQEELVRIVPPPHPGLVPSGSLRLLEALREDDAVVVFFPSGEARVLRSSGVERVTTFDTERIGDMCSRYRTLVSLPGRPDDEEELVRVEAAIAAACIEPLFAHLRDASRVLMVPSGSLWQVPLASLGPHPLAERYAVSIVPNLSVAILLLERTRPARRVERFVGIGNPDDTLPSAADEVEHIANGFDNHAVRTGKDVDFGEALTLFIDADVIHLACHGVSFPEYPELSYLHIAGPPEDPVPWYVEDVIRIAMAPRLVVLSACHAGTSTALEGNEYVGFPGAFLVADATTVIAPLWAVPDTATRLLMETFYEEARHLPVSRALRSAQNVVRADPAFAHPRNWAAFEVFGLP